MYKDRGDILAFQPHNAPPGFTSRGGSDEDASMIVAVSPTNRSSGLLDSFHFTRYHQGRTL